MSRLAIEITLDNAAFEDNREDEISHCLEIVKWDLKKGLQPGMTYPVFDSNGNRTGNWAIFEN